MQNAYKIQPSFYTLFSLGIKITEDSNRKPETMSGLVEEKKIFRIAGHRSCSSAPPFLSEMQTLWIVSTLFNHNALRKAKIVYNFGLYECNRVNENNILQYISQYGCHVWQYVAVWCSHMETALNSKVKSLLRVYPLLHLFL